MGVYVHMCVYTCMLWGEEEGMELLLSGAAFPHPPFCCCLSTLWRSVETQKEDHDPPTVSDLSAHPHGHPSVQ